MQTLVKSNQMIPAILTDQLQYGRAASVSRKKVQLFVPKLCLRQAQQYLGSLWLSLSKMRWVSKPFIIHCNGPKHQPLTHNCQKIVIPCCWHKLELASS